MRVILGACTSVSYTCAWCVQRLCICVCEDVRARFGMCVCCVSVYACLCFVYNEQVYVMYKLVLRVQMNFKSAWLTSNY